MKHYEFIPKGVCAQKIAFDYENGNIYNLVFEGGCRGNLAAIGKLCEGRNLEEIASIFSGNTCGMKDTSCCGELAKAIEEVIA